MCSKHVEAWNKLIVKQKFCASSWLITEINSIVLYKFAKLREANISLVMSVRLYVRYPSSWNNMAPTGRIYNGIWHLSIFRKPVAKFQGSLKSDIMTKTLLFSIITRPFLLRMRKLSAKSCTESQNKHFIFPNLFRKSCHLWDIVEKWCRVGQATDDNMVHSHCMMGT